MRDSAELIDARARYSAEPETFEVPSKARIDQVQPGVLVKIGVQFPENAEGMEAERFWVEVTQREGDHLVGRIENELLFTEDHGLRLGDTIEFEARNLLDTDTFDYLASVEYVDTDADTEAGFMVGVVGRHARIWVAAGDERIVTTLGPGHRDLDEMIRVLIEAREWMVAVLHEIPMGEGLPEHPDLGPRGTA